jgi:propanol-preferring alcohol dehydrogenase
MLSMQVLEPGAHDLTPIVSPTPDPGPGEVLIRVRACGDCRTDLHIVDGELTDGVRPVTPGHEIVGIVDRVGAGTDSALLGRRVGVPWLASTCGTCAFCTSGQENLCRAARFTGYHVPGGFATHATADARFVVPLPDAYDDLHAAPLLCAGLIGHRAYRMAGDAQRLGLYGFGAAAHIVAQVASHQGRDVFAFVSPGDDAAAAFARQSGALWAGASTDAPPVPLDAAILFAPVGALVPEALSRVRPGGVVVCAGIHMSDIPAFPYRLLWEERVLRSVANLTRADATSFMAVAREGFIRTHVRAYPLELANAALADLRSGRVNGAAVLVPE